MTIVGGPCTNCGAMPVESHRFCAGCGRAFDALEHAIDEAVEDVAESVAAAWSRKGFRGPKYTGIAGAALTVTGGLMTLVSLASLSGLSLLGMGADAASGNNPFTHAFGVAAVLVTGACICAFGVFLLLWSGVWGAGRIGRGERTAAAAGRARQMVAEHVPSVPDREQLREQVQRAKPQVDAAVRQGAEALKSDIAPRVEAGAAKASAAARAGAARGSAAAQGAASALRARQQRKRDGA